MKNFISLLIIVVTALVVNPTVATVAPGQDDEPAPTLFIAGGALSESMYQLFVSFASPNAKLVVIPTASGEEPDVEKIKEFWQSRGIRDVRVLHTRDRGVALNPEFSEPLRTATAVWFSGGSQQRIADVYLGTPVEEELYKLLQRGGIIGGSSAGAAIQSKIMISGGKKKPKISTGFDLLHNAIIDQHFLKRNRISRLMAAVRAHPERVGFGIDEDTAILVYDNQYKVIGKSYVLRIRLIEGKIEIDAFEDGDTIPLQAR